MSLKRLVVVCGLLPSCAPVLGIEDTVLDTSATCTLVTHRIFFADKPIEATTVEVSIPTHEQFAKAAERLGISLAETNGHALAGMRDCAGNLLEDAVLEFQPDTLAPDAFIVDEGSIELGSDTSEPGHAGLWNLAAGTEVDLLALPLALAGEASSIGDLTPRPSELSYIMLDPNSEAGSLMIDPVPDAFSCLPRPSMMPPPGTMEITFTVVVRQSAFLDPAVGEPMVGARVRACPDVAGPCDEPVFTTDESGTATVVADIDDEGFDGQLVIEGELPGCR